MIVRCALLAFTLSGAIGVLSAQQPPQPPSSTGFPGGEGVAPRPGSIDVPPVYARPAIDTIATIRRRGILRVGVAPSMPWVMRDRDGELMGFSIDLGRKLAEEMGVELEVVPTSWPHIVGDLMDNHFDVIASGLWITPARALMVNYTQPTSMGAVSLIAGRAVAANLGEVTDFDRPEVSLVVNQGTEMEELASRRFPRTRLVRIDINDDPLAAVLEGKAHGAVVMSPAARMVVEASGNRLFLPDGAELETASAALALRKGDPDFLNFLNAWLTYHRETGWLTERYGYWFTATDWMKRL
jgi:polar amino acid transport system substrate-binding protein